MGGQAETLSASTPGGEGRPGTVCGRCVEPPSAGCQSVCRRRLLPTPFCRASQRLLRSVIERVLQACSRAVEREAHAHQHTGAACAARDREYIARAERLLAVRCRGGISGERWGRGAVGRSLYMPATPLNVKYTQDPPRAIIIYLIKVGHSTCTCLCSVTGESLRWPSVACSVVGELLRRPSYLI